MLYRVFVGVEEVLLKIKYCHKKCGAPFAHFPKQPRSPSSALSHPFFGWEGSPAKIDYRKKGTLILTSLLEDLDDNMYSLW